LRHQVLGVASWSLLCLVLWSSAAPAAEALYLNWDQCGPSGGSLRGSSCSTNLGDQRIYCAFTLGTPLDQVVGVEVVVDLQHADADLPAWWQFGVGGCRQGALSANGGPPAGADCVDFWQGMATGGIQGFAVGQPRGGPNQARIKVALSLLPPDARSLDAQSLYNAATIVISNQNTVGTGSCPGCAGDACLVLNGIWIKRLPGAPGGDVLVKTPGLGSGNMASWQGTGVDCSAVPTHKDSWGRIKTLYR
jgi:hypothetical protein